MPVDPSTGESISVSAAKASREPSTPSSSTQQPGETASEFFARRREEKASEREASKELRSEFEQSGIKSRSEFLKAKRAEARAESLKETTKTEQQIAREGAFAGLSPSAKVAFLKTATTSEVGELRKGTGVEAISIGSEGTLREKREGGTRLISKDVEKSSLFSGGLIQTTTRDIIDKQPVIVSKERKETASKLTSVVGKGLSFVTSGISSEIEEIKKGFAEAPLPESFKRAGETAIITGSRFGQSFLLGSLGTIKSLTTPVKTTKEAVSGVKQIITSPLTFGRELVTQFKADPFGLTGQVAGEFAITKGILKGAGKGVKLAKRVSLRVSPKFSPIKEGAISLADDLTIKVVKPGRIPTEPVPTQVGLAGQKVTAVSASKDIFGRIIPKKEIIVGKFKGAEKIGTFERSIFFDPQSRVRVSRLQVGSPQRAASLKEILKGEFQLTSPKKSIVVLADTPVQQFPKSLSGVVEKLKRGSQLTPEETIKLRKFQTTPSGKVKPLGFVSVESEVTLAPGEILKKGAKLGTTEIGGEPISIFAGEIGTATKETTMLLKVGREGLLTSTEQLKLTKSLVSETGFSIGEVSSGFGRELPLLQPSRVTGGIGLLRTPAFEHESIKKQQISREPSRQPSTIKEPISTISIPSPISREIKISRRATISGVSKPFSPIGQAKPIILPSPIAQSPFSPLPIVKPVAQGRLQSPMFREEPVKPLIPETEKKIRRIEIFETKDLFGREEITPSLLALEFDIIATPTEAAQIRPIGAFGIRPQIRIPAKRKKKK